MIRSCNVAICYRLLIYSNLVTGSNVLGFCILTVVEMIYLVLHDRILPYFSTTKSRTKMGRAGSGPEFHVNFESGWVTYLWVGLGRSRKLDPRPLWLQAAGYGANEPEVC